MENGSSNISPPPPADSAMNTHPDGGPVPSTIIEQPMTDMSSSAPAPGENGVPPLGPPADQANGGGVLIGSAHVKPVFFGNLDFNTRAEDIEDLFLRPILDGCPPIPVDRVDLKRGFGFVFLEDAKSQEDKARIESYVQQLSGMSLPRISSSLRAEFARGDGRIKRKEDDRRKKILPNETLFVVNFHEETTKKEDLEMLFQPHGQLVRIDMKKNFAFVQFTNIEDATKAKEATNGGKLDQSVITVEYVAQRDRRNDRDRRGDRDRDRDYSRGRDGYRRDDDYSPRRRDDSRRRDDRYDDYRDRGRSPPRDRHDGYRRGRSRSRSPPYRYRSRSRSPRRDGGRDRDDSYRGGRSGGYDGYRGGGRGDSRGDYRDGGRDAGRGRSSERGDRNDRGGDRGERDYRNDDARGYK